MLDGVKIYAVIAAAGQGSRMRKVAGNKTYHGKQMLELKGMSVIGRTCQTFESCEFLDGYVVTASELERAEIEKELKDFLAEGKCMAVIPGGKRRQDSVACGLTYLRTELGKNSQIPIRNVIALVHDGARCLITKDLIYQVALKIHESGGGAVAAMPSTDTLRLREKDGSYHLIPREKCFAMQTPQGAPLEMLNDAFLKLNEKGQEVTDEVQALLNADYPCELVPGEATNIKLTHPEDLAIAEFYLQNLLE